VDRGVPFAGEITNIILPEEEKVELTKKNEVPSKMIQPLALNERQAAKLIGRSVQTLRNWRCQGREIPYVRQGRSISYLYDDIVAWLDSHRIDPEAR
jgi:hypothetical protein